MKLCESNVGIRLVRMRLLEMESERDGRNKSSLSFVFVDFFPPTDRGKKYLNIFWARNCFFCSPVVSLPRYSHQKLLTHSISHRRRNLLQTPRMHPRVHKQPKTDAQTLLRYCRNMFTVFTQTHACISTV